MCRGKVSLRWVSDSERHIIGSYGECNVPSVAEVMSGGLRNAAVPVLVSDGETHSICLSCEFTTSSAGAGRAPSVVMRVKIAANKQASLHTKS